MEKVRIDKLLVDKEITNSRERAKSYIMEGLVLINGERIDKPGFEVDKNSEITIKKKLKYVSRGGLKLEKAIKEYKLDCNNKVCLDIGCSTGGFTDCMLQNGAKKVYAVDVGYGQLDYKLRIDERVIVLERINARYLDHKVIKEKIDFATVDVSFISTKLIIPAIKNLQNQQSKIVLLIKPQFEAGKDRVGKNGVVRDKNTHIEVINNIYHFLIEEELYPKILDFSPIKGPKGNIEYLMIIDNIKSKIFDKAKIKELVEIAHNKLNT